MNQPMHVELSNGQSAELREVATLTEGDAEDINVALYEEIPRKPNGDPITDNINPFRFQKAQERSVLAAVIESWTFDIPVPTADDLTPFRTLSVVDAGLLTKASEPHRKALSPDFAPSEDEESPTKPSND